MAVWYGFVGARWQIKMYEREASIGMGWIEGGDFGASPLGTQCSLIENARGYFSYSVVFDLNQLCKDSIDYNSVVDFRSGLF